MRRHGFGQPIRVEGPKSHETKRGTPTMGGTVFVIAALIGYVVGHGATDDPFTPSGVLVLLLMTGLGGVGFIDDFFKIFRQSSAGIRSRAKLGGQFVVAAVFAVEVLQRPNAIDLTPPTRPCPSCETSGRLSARCRSSSGPSSWSPAPPMR